MLKHGKNKRVIAMAAATLAIAGGATIGLGGTANAAVGNPDPSTTDWFSLYLSNNGTGTGRYFQVCSEQSAANTVWVAVDDETDIRAGTRVELQDVNSGWTTYGAYINFSPGGCEEFYIINTRFGDALQGYINPGSRPYGTGIVRYN